MPDLTIPAGAGAEPSGEATNEHSGACPGATTLHFAPSADFLKDMELTDAMEFVRAHPRGVLVTQKRDGRPQLSNIAYSVGDDGVVRISITADRAKYRNLQRTPLASLHVTRQDFYAYVVLDADVELSEVAASPDDAAVDELVEQYRAVAGEHPDWDDYRAAMVKDRRLVVRLKPTHAYGMLPS